MRILTFVPLLGAAAAAACVRVATTPLETRTTYATVSPDSVRVFATQAPERYTEIAVLRTQRFVASDAKTLRALRERAGRLGANGLLLLNTRGAVSTTGDITGVILGRRGGILSGQVENEVDEFKRAVAIRYTPPAAPTPSGVSASTPPS